MSKPQNKPNYLPTSSQHAIESYTKQAEKSSQSEIVARTCASSFSGIGVL